METTGSFDYCRKILRDLHEKAVAMIESLDEGSGQGTGIKFFLDKMSVWTAILYVKDASLHFIQALELIVQIRKALEIKILYIVIC